MRSNVALLVTLLLVAAGVLAPVGVGAGATPAETNPLIVSVNNTANSLAIPADEVRRTGDATDGLSLGTAIADGTGTFQSDFVRISFKRSYENAETEREKTAAIRSAADRIERRSRVLERRDRRAIGAFANGTMTVGEFTRERARINGKAERLEAAIERVRNTASTDNSYSLSTRLEDRLVTLTVKLETLQGPVSDHVTAASSGDVRSQNIYAEVSDSGYTLAYVTEDVYVRETYLGDERRPNGTDTFRQGSGPGTSAADLRGYELYPWMVNHSVSPNTFGFGSSGIYRFTSGELTAYIDGNTTNVFREAQRHKLAAMPTSRSRSNVNGTLRLRVNETYQTGPMEISLVRNGTGEPANGTVWVDGRSKGTTGPDGHLWIVEPRGANRVQVTTADNETVAIALPS